MKKITALVLAVILLLSTTAALAEFNTIQFPLVKEGEKKVTLTAAFRRNYSKAIIPPEESWFWQYMQQASGIEFELIPFAQDALSERKNLMFASQEVADVMIGLELGTNELVKYGMGEKQLLALEPYITEDIMPNVYAWLEAYPQARAYATAPDGHMYTLPSFSAASNAVGNTTSVDINYAALKELGLETPTTLNDFVAALYAFKKAKPDSIPLGYSKTSYSGGLAFLQRAFGFVTESSGGVEPAIRNGEAVLPVYDDVFGEYLKLAHQLYEDGILSKDMYTTDDMTLKADTAEGKVLVFPSAVYVCNADKSFWQDWHTVVPLTSEYCEKGIWKQYNINQIGGVAVSASTQYPELICRFLDYFWSNEGGLSLWEGPVAGSEQTLGILKGWTADASGKLTRLDVTEDGWNAQELANSHMGGWSRAVGNRSNWLGREDEGFINMNNTYAALAGNETIEPFSFDMENGDSFARYYKDEILTPFITPGFPAFTYVDEDTSIAISDLKTVINTYSEGEIAKFITGVRDVSEYPKFKEELKAMGAEELLGYYQQMYSDYLKNL